MTAQKLFAICLVVSALAVPGFSQHIALQSVEDSYENHNQIDYGPLKVSLVKGVAVDPFGAPVPQARILLFTDEKHELIAKSKTNDAGLFHMLKVADGKYRLIAKAQGFCSANVPLVVKTRSGAPGLVLHMKPGAIDSCSYGALK